jgi:hypothetical protein
MVDYAKLANEIRNIVPGEHDTFRALLQNRRESIRFSAPEVLGLHVENLLTCIVDYCGNGPDFSEPWQTEIFEAWQSAHN